MTKVWPNEIPMWVAKDPRRSAEIKVFKALKDSLGRDWSVYYSRPWWGLDSKGAEIDGECDFIVIHPDHGVLFIEVKGGRIEFNPEDGKWKSTDRHGIRKLIKDPIQQAMRSKHEILKKLRSNTFWPRSKVIARHGAIFPDVLRPNEPIIAGYEIDLFAFSNELKDGIDSWVLRRLTQSRSSDESVPSTFGVTALDMLYAQPVELSTSLNSRIDSDLATLDSLLTGAQLQTLLSIEEDNRSVIHGGAGTGKTVLATELASRKTKNGFKTLFLCTNESLKLHLSRKFVANKLLTLWTFSDLVVNFELLDNENTTWDCVIIDEGQDVDFNWWTRIEKLCGASGSLAIFLDSNQSVYRKAADIATLIEANTYLLRLNLRNTTNIARVTEPLYEGPPIFTAGPEGEEIGYIACTFDDGIFLRLSDEVEALINVEKITPESIAIIAENESDLAKVCEALQAKNISNHRSDQTSQGSIIVETVARFKGLESRVLFFLVSKSASEQRELCYIAVSRARAKLYILGSVEKFRS